MFTCRMTTLIWYWLKPAGCSRRAPPLLAGVWTGARAETVRVEERGRRFYSIRPPGEWLDRLQTFFGLERWWTDTDLAEVEHDYLWCLLRA